MQKRRFEALIEDCHADVYRAALGMTGDPHEAADVVQSIYLDVLDGRLDLERAESPCGLLRYHAVKRSLMARRSAGLRRQREAQVMTRDKVSRAAAQDALGRERDERIWDEVMVLPDDLRRPLLLRYREQLGLREVGELLGLPVQTVHDRINRGQAKLRPRLDSLGYAGLALPALMADMGAPSAPVALKASLAGLLKPGLAVLLTKAVALIVVVGAVGFGALTVLDDDAPPALESGVDRSERALGLPRRGSASDEGEASGSLLIDEEKSTGSFLIVDDVGAPVAPEAGRDEPTRPLAAPIVEQDETTGRLIGRILDDTDRPIGGALVRANSTEFVGKVPRHSRSVRSDGDGRFAIEVPVEPGTTRAYRLWIRMEHHQPRSTSGRETGVAATVDFGDLVLPRKGSGAAGLLRVLVRGPDGKPHGQSAVELLKLIEQKDGSLWPNPGQRAFSNSEGIVEIPVNESGAYRIRVFDRRGKLARRVVDLGELDTGIREETVLLEAGHRLVVRASDPEGRSARGLELVMSNPRDPNEWIHGKLDEEGIVFENLATTPHRLWNSGGPWSDFELKDVDPKRGLLDLVVKRSEDPRDVGTHASEIHMRVVDGRNGSVIELGPFELETYRTDVEGDDELILRDVAPWHVAEPFAQRAILQTDEIDLPPVPAGEGMSRSLGLDAGTWLAVIRRPGFAHRVLGPFRLGESDVLVLDRVELQPARELRGRVVDAGGRAVARATVYIGGDGEYSREKAEEYARRVIDDPYTQRYLTPGGVITDQEGRFVLKAIPERLSFRVHAVAARAGRARTGLIDPEDSDAELVLRLESE